MWLIASARGGGFKFRFDPNRYQIFFFNSCSSYTYYNTLYFNRKRDGRRGLDAKGTLNLDILANGSSTEFGVETDLDLVKAVILWARIGQWTSYQTLARRLDVGNLFAVNGDEDNPTQPVR